MALQNVAIKGGGRRILQRLAKREGLVRLARRKPEWQAGAGKIDAIGREHWESGKVCTSRGREVKICARREDLGVQSLTLQLSEKRTARISNSAEGIQPASVLAAAEVEGRLQIVFEVPFGYQMHRAESVTPLKNSMELAIAWGSCCSRKSSSLHCPSLFGSVSNLEGNFPNWS